ncbi:hypothetical protein O3G_MSEX001992 [Manduca sexta]|uniref:Cyclic nucleotide-binding domain-containing protein n=1 Tax=Manduca sexta TaxID=7130 RepID=A0A921YM31_MANSE|nr:hypothetical protein O3G_MSEX001992 [Manduca sexta]
MSSYFNAVIFCTKRKKEKISSLYILKTSLCVYLLYKIFSIRRKYMMPFKKHHCQLGLGSDSMLLKKPGLWANLYRSMRKMCQVAQYHPDTYDHFRSYPAVVAERQRQLYEGDKNLIHPLSLVSLCWHTIMAFVNLMHMFISTLRLFFVLTPPRTQTVHAIDKVLLAFHALCFLDILFNFNIGYTEKEYSHIVMKRRKIVCHYLRRWFLLDLASCLPVAFVLLYLDLKDTQCLLFAHILPLLRTPRLYTALIDVKVFTKIFTRSYIWYGMMRHAVLFVMTAHWCTCFVYLPPVLCYYWYGKIPWKYNRFLKDPDRDLWNIDLQNRYRKGMFIVLSSFFGTGFSMFRASEPEEIVIHALIILYSAMFMVYTLVLLLKVYMTTYSSTVRYHELMNQVEEYMTYKQFPAPLKKRVRAFYNYRYQELYYREETALDCLSEELRNEITLHTCHKLVNKVALFEGVSASVVGSVLGCLRPEVFLPNDPVVRAGDIGECMYFIANGTVAVYSLKGVEVCHLEDGAHFGEVALLMRDSKRVATVVAVEITQLYRLDAEDFRHFLLTHDVYERIESLASKRMHETVLLDEAFRRDRLSEKHQGEIPHLGSSN